MGMSRATVIAYLNEARERGIVNISIEPARLASLSLAQSLKSHFNLRDCLVVPDSGDDRALAQRLGAAGALALRKYLKSGDTLAVSGGRTMMAVGANLRIVGLQDVTVVQAIGGAAAKNPAAPSLCASAIASALNAMCVNLSAPAVTSTAEARAIMVAEQLVAEQLQILLQANKALFGISALRPKTSLDSDGLFEGCRHPTLPRRRRCWSSGCALHRCMGKAGRWRPRRSRDRLVSRRPAARRSTHLRGRRLRQSACDPGGVAPRLRQRAGDGRRHSARRSARRWGG